MDKIINVRYRGCVPKIETEGCFKIPMKVSPACDKKSGWHRDLPPWERLASHHTLSTARKFIGFACNKAPRDELDFVLESTFNATSELFPEKVDVYFQPETLGETTWRKLRNTIEIIPPKPIPLGHPLRIGGITEKKDPNNVKLMNSGPHSPQTNAGYIRNGDAGNVFYY